jgi:two-component system response regulator FixJ
MRGRRRNMGDRRVIHLVDDEESIRKASFALKTAGYDVVTYASGVEFLKEAKSAAVGCVILDVRMPEMDGLEIQAAMAARGSICRSSS